MGISSNRSSVGTGVLEDGSVTNPKLGNTSVGVTKIANDAVTTLKILNSAVTNDKIATGLDAVKIGDGTVTNTEFQYLGDVTSLIQIQLDSIISESVEQDSTPVIDDVEDGSATSRWYYQIQIPSLYKFIIPTGISWKNGTVVAGNVICGLSLASAIISQDSQPLLAVSDVVSQTPINTIQRTSLIKPCVIKGGSFVSIWISQDNATGKLRGDDVPLQIKNRKSIAYTSTPAVQDASAFSNANISMYLILHFIGYS